MSIFHRFTGAALAFGIYGFGIGYAIAQPGGITESMVEVLGNQVPHSLMVGGKFILALPFFYHTFNGIRHLVTSS